MSARQFGLRGNAASSGGLGRLVMTLIVLCTSACYRPATEARPRGSWAYEVDAPTSGSRTVSVEATFDAAHTERLGLPKEAAPYVRDLKVRDPDGVYRTVERRGNEWFERSCNWRCTVSYKVDLGEVAAHCGDEVDCARRVGAATLSPALAWLVHPVPRTDVPVTVRVHTKDSAQFASGMSAASTDGNTFAFRSFDLDEGSFTAFGPMRLTSIEVPGRNGRKARLDVAMLGSGKYAMPDAEMKSWIEEAANVTVPLFGRFPVDRATLFVVPAKGEEEVTFGKVLSLAGASVVVVVGDKMPATKRHRDWVLVHELFHLGFPTFRGEGRWLGEGLATYYEPILRARAGWTTESEVFRQFARNMPRGQAPRGSSAGLSARDDLDTIYWGGAMFCLAADVRIREETRGQKSLDDVIRAALDRGGDATHVWTVRDVVSLGDRVTGTTVLSDMYERHAARGERIDLEGLLDSLGEDGSLAWVRRGIAQGTNRETLAQTP
jgi:hypothetical protein